MQIDCYSTDVRIFLLFCCCFLLAPSKLHGHPAAAAPLAHSFFKAEAMLDISSELSCSPLFLPKTSLNICKSKQSLKPFSCRINVGL